MRLLLLATACAAAQFPFFDYQSSQRTKTPQDVYIDHFSDNTVDSGIRIQTAIEAIYSNSSILTTQSRYFDLFRYAQIASEPFEMTERKDLGDLRRVGFMKGRRREPADRHDRQTQSREAFMSGMMDSDSMGETGMRDGGARVATSGATYEEVSFGAYSVRWRGEDLLAILATWPEDWDIATQWHLIGNKDAASAFFTAVAEATSTFVKVVWVFDMGYWRPSAEMWDDVQKADWKDVILDPDFKESLQKDYRTFLSSEDTYKRLGVPWKRGLIFLGSPGNGKTISLKAIMKEVDIPTMYVKSLHVPYMPDEMSISAVFAGARREAPCLLVFEDLDSMITDENRSYFLNEVDGMDGNDGLLMIATTNHFDRLDPALSNRPSRFDRKYKFPDPNLAERKQYAVYWQKKVNGIDGIDFPDKLVDEFAAKTDKFSFAYMKEAFVSTLLAIAGNEGKHEVDFGKMLMKEVKHLRKQLDDGDDDDK